MKRILFILFAVLTVLIPAVLSAAPHLPFDAVTSQSRDYSSALGNQFAFNGVVSGSANNDTLVIDTWLWFGSYVDPDSVLRNSFDWPSGTNGDDAFVGGEWYLMVTQTADGAAPLGEFSPITAWDASAGQVVVSPVFSATVAQYEHVAIVHRNLIPVEGVITKTGLAGTAAADSLTCFTAVGNVWINGLSLETTVGAGGTSELANFAIGLAGGTGTGYVRVGLGKDLNNLAAGVIEYVDPKEVLLWAIAADTTISTKTPVLTDSLGYTRNVTQVQSPQLARRDWRIFVPDGHIIKLLLPGSSTTTRVAVSAQWKAAETGAYLRK